MARKILGPVGTCPEGTGASLEGHLLAKRGITGTSELAMRSSPWEKGGASVIPWCVLTQEAPQKSAEGAVEWEMASIDWSTDATHLQGSGSDPTLKLGPQRRVTGSGQQAGLSSKLPEHRSLW